jgi:hypothetical protein
MSSACNFWALSTWRPIESTNGLRSAEQRPTHSGSCERGAQPCARISLWRFKGWWSRYLEMSTCARTGRPECERFPVWIESVTRGTGLDLADEQR